MTAAIRNLGKLSGPVLVFGGVYSNYQALEALQEIAHQRKIPSSNIICTGDIVGYCAQPEECVQAIQSWGIAAIVGNVELNLAEKLEDCGCNFDEGGRCDLFSRQWYPYAQSALSDDSLSWIAALSLFLQFEYCGKKMIVLHGSYFNTSEFIFKSTPWSVKAKNVEAIGANCILAGHCGIPFADIQDHQYWLNAGVIGMPANDGSPDVWYLLLDDSDGFSFTFETLNYDYKEAQKRMLEKPLPRSYAETLTTGIWDNCEILPEAETQQQGMVLKF